MLATSRMCTTGSGEKIKWRGTQHLNCIALDTGVQLVTYDRVRYHPFRRWESTLNVSPSAMGIIDELIGERRELERALGKSLRDESYMGYSREESERKEKGRSMSLPVGQLPPSAIYQS
ncbi:unnamed protein product [Rhizoctonia solani]|uniref:Uncharacterized protein n=1 Tax=Rhizoctonia solani TaxID=456999 RepID=A0A8H3DHG0_9AGAM|nr:unnamed protein product [Rhizoctonia solani]